MNKRQSQIVGVAIILLAGVSLWQGLENEDPFLTFALPIILIAGLLVFELRDKATDRPKPAETGQTVVRKVGLMPFLLAVQFLCVAFTAVVAYQARTAAEDAASAGQDVDLSSVESSLSSVDDKLDDIESKLNHQSLEISLIQSRLTFR